MGRRHHRPVGHAARARARARRGRERADSRDHVRRLSYVALAVLLLCACGGTQKSERWIAWSANLGEEPNLWIARSDGSGRRLFERRAYAPSVSPDGRWIAYDGCIEPSLCLHGTGPYGLHVRRTDGSGRRLLLRGRLPVAWSPRSDRLVAQHGRRLVSVDIASGAVTVLDRGGFVGFSFAADGRLVYARSAKRYPIVCGDGIDLYVNDGHTKRRLTRDGHNAWPVWGPGRIAYAHWQRHCGRHWQELWVMRENGGGVRRVVRLSRVPGGVYGLMPIDWRPGAFLGGISTEWGPIALRVDPRTGAYRRIAGDWTAVQLSHDGRDVLLFAGGAEPPFTIAWAPFAGGRKHVLARGDVGWVSWNR